MQSRYELEPVNKKTAEERAELSIASNQPSSSNKAAPRSLFYEAPVDKFNIVWIVLLIHGIGTLMPWNMFINAEAYFREFKLNQNLTDQAFHRDASANSSLPIIANVQLEDYRKNFISYIGLASQLPNIIFNGLNLLANIGSGNLKLRVNLTLIVEGIVFILTIVLAVLDSSSWPITFFYITMASVVVLNMSNGIYQNCIFGAGAKFPMSYTNAILIGSNISGTFTSLVNLLSIWVAPQPQVAAIYYFVTALFVILICIISYNLLPLNPFYKYIELKAKDPSAANTDDYDHENPVKDVSLASMNIPEEEHETNCADELKSKWEVFMLCWQQCLNVFLTFFLTLALFPAVLADIQQIELDSYGISRKYFTPLACFLVFNLFAMVGNLITSKVSWPGKSHVWILVAARFAFIPFFLFCNFNPKTRKWPVLIKSDSAYITGNVLLAATSGYLSSLCMMFASAGLPGKDAQKAGMIAAFFLVAGIFFGVNSSFILRWLVETIEWF